MQKEPLAIEWELVESQESETQLLEAFKVLLNDEYIYEKTAEETV